MNPLKENKCGIKCEWMKSKRALINPDGQVWPCCYLANVTYTGYRIDETSNDYSRSFAHHVKNRSPTLLSYDNDKEKYNLFNNSLEDIVNGEWFTKTLPESWNDSDLTIAQCKEFCSTK